MRATLLVFLATIALGVKAQDVERDDLPRQCKKVCASTVNLTRRCDANTGDDDNAYINCVCNSRNARSLIPNCEACVAKYGEIDNDVRDIVRSCSFSIQQTFTTPSATRPATVNGSAATSSTSSSSDPDNDNGDNNGSSSGSGGSSGGSEESGGNSGVGVAIPVAGASLSALIIAIVML